MWRLNETGRPNEGTGRRQERMLLLGLSVGDLFSRLLFGFFLGGRIHARLHLFR